VFSDRDSRQLGRPSPENAGGQDAKNLRVKVFYAKFVNFGIFFFVIPFFIIGFILLHVACRFEEVNIVVIEGVCLLLQTVHFLFFYFK
jgi:hypothetical protein